MMVVGYKGIIFSDLDLFTSRVLVPAIRSRAKAYPYLLPYTATKPYHSTKEVGAQVQNWYFHPLYHSPGFPDPYPAPVSTWFLTSTMPCSDLCFSDITSAAPLILESRVYDAFADPFIPCPNSCKFEYRIL